MTALSELKALVEAATPNWYVHCESGLGTFLARVVTDDPVSIEVVSRRVDLELCAALRNSAPALIAVAEAARRHAHFWDCHRALMNKLLNSDDSGDVNIVDPAFRPAGSLSLVEALAALEGSTP